MRENIDIKELTEKVKESSANIYALRTELEKVIVGQKQMIEKIAICLLSNSHLLLEGVPGLAKTLTIKTFASTISAEFKRIQFTPDLLPADIIGTEIYNQKKAEFTTKKGPIFANIILADEINRSPAKVQSALLEAMEEHQVTIGDNTYKLDEPFLVMATQNPIEQEGTYPLPEAQVDRFMFKVLVDYPTKEEEKKIIKTMSVKNDTRIRKVLTTKDILGMRELIENIHIEEKIIDYITNIVFATRKPSEYGMDDDFISFGASPRASLYLTKAAKAYAFINGRGFVIPEDVRVIGYDVLRHRIILSYEAEAENISTDDIITKVFDTVEVP